MFAAQESRTNIINQQRIIKCLKYISTTIISLHIHIHMCVYVYIYIHTHTYTYMCMYRYVRIYIYTYMHTHTHTHTVEVVTMCRRVVGGLTGAVGNFSK